MKRVHSQTRAREGRGAVGGYRAGGLGVVGPEDTLEALIKGQVDELLIAARVRELQPVGARPRRRRPTASRRCCRNRRCEPVAAGEAGRRGRARRCASPTS